MTDPWRQEWMQWIPEKIERSRQNMTELGHTWSIGYGTVMECYGEECWLAIPLYLAYLARFWSCISDVDLIRFVVVSVSQYFSDFFHSHPFSSILIHSPVSPQFLHRSNRTGLHFVGVRYLALLRLWPPSHCIGQFADQSIAQNSEVTWSYTIDPSFFVFCKLCFSCSTVFHSIFVMKVVHIITHICFLASLEAVKLVIYQADHFWPRGRGRRPGPGGVTTAEATRLYIDARLSGNPGRHRQNRHRNSEKTE